MRQHFAIHPIKIKDTDIQNVTMTLYTLVTVIFRIIFTQNFQWISSLHFLGLIDADYAGAGLKTVDSTLPVMFFMTTLKLNIQLGGFGGLEVACWPLVTKFVGSHLAEAVRFLGRKNPQHTFLRRGRKLSVPCHSFTACKRFLNVTCKLAFRQNYRTHLAHNSSFRCWVLSRGDAWWQKLEHLTKITQ
jgi:hypothetical protein